MLSETLLHCELVKDTKIGITLATSPVLPENDSKEAVESARTEYFACRAEHVEWSESFWLDPIAKGSYPASLLKERAHWYKRVIETNGAEL